MTISRRQALAWASAFAANAGITGTGAASALKNAVALGRGTRNNQTAQRFQELLIHRDEAGHLPHNAVVSIASRDAAWYAIDTLDDLTYRTTNRQNKKHGFRLKRVSAFKTRQGVRYAGCWEQVAGPEWHSRHGMSRQEFDAACADFTKRGFRMTHVDARVHYAAIWEKGDATTQQTFAQLTSSEYQQQYAAMTAQGLRPTRLSIAVANGAPFFAAIFEKDAGTAWQSNVSMNAADFHKAAATMKSQGYRLSDASAIMLNGKPSFTGIWELA